MVPTKPRRLNARDGFTSPRTRNQLVDNLTQEKILAIEGGYLLRAPRIKARATGYFTRFEDQIFNRSLFLDALIVWKSDTRGGFVNYIMQGINTQHAGVELAVEGNITSRWRASAVAAIGHIYTNRPTRFYLVRPVRLKSFQNTLFISMSSL
ncbi:MAG: hypothetical protein R2795_10445 [Saprospiraceae bacterium]